MEQSGTAKKLTGQILENWLVSFADGHGGIQSIVKKSTSGLVDTYRITLADTTTFDFLVTNGKSINSISKTNTSGLVDTYTIRYNDNTSGSFTVTNGAKGDKGDNQYVWIKYASQKPTASSHSFGDVADNWIGIYSGDSATAPTDWTQYEWFQIKGEKGDTGAAAQLTSSAVEYQVGDSGTIIPSGAWSSSVPVVAQGRYLWTRTTNNFNTGSPVVSYSVSRMGLDGTGSVSSVAGISPNSDGNVPLDAASVNALAITGGVMEGQINMNGQKITGLNVPTADNEVATKGYADAFKYYVTPQMFGAMANNQDDDTDAIQAAIDFVESKGGGTVFFPAGTYVISNTLRIKAHGVKLQGDCMQSAYIRQSDATKGGIEFYNENGTVLSGVTVNHISLYCLEGSSGVGIHYNGCVNAFADNIIIENFKVGLRLTGTGNSSVKNVGVVSRISGAIGFSHGMKSISTQYVNIFAGFFGDAKTTGIGFDASKGNIADFMIDYLDVGNGYIGVRINGSESPNDLPPADIRLHEIVVDGCINNGIYIGNINQRGNVLVMGGWINPSVAPSGSGVTIVNAENVTINGITIQQVKTGTPIVSGIASTGSKNISIQGVRLINLIAPISVSGVEKCNFSNNTIETYDTTPFSGVGIHCVGAIRTNVVNNTVSGGYTYGMVVDATSTKCIVAMNNADGTIISVSAADSITDNNLV